MSLGFALQEARQGLSLHNMPHVWKDAPKLPRRWRLALGFLELAGPLFIAVISVFLAYGTFQAVWWVMGIVAVAVLTVAAIAKLKWSDLQADPQKLYIDTVLEVLGTELWVRHSKLRGPLQRHRITLFELKRRSFLARRWNGAWTHKLVPRTRVPHSGSLPRRVWRVHEHYSEQCEGIAGQVFANDVLVSEKLPDLHGSPVADSTFSEYARLSNDKEKAVRRERYYAQRIGGIGVRIEGRRWGVLVLDSQDPHAIDLGRLQGSRARRVLTMLTRILSKSES